jgi:hypothetical protein
MDLAAADAQRRHLVHRVAQHPGGGNAVDAGMTVPGEQRQIASGP